MAGRRNWTRDELLLALRLYVRLPFGQLHHTNPEIVAVAERIGRTPSAVAMKAVNFASLDPAITATGRSGLANASRADRAMWDDFTNDPEAIAFEAEALADPAADTATSTDEHLPSPPDGPTEVERLVRTRRVQSFFRSAVLVSYDHRCEISGFALPELLVASHIVPWKDSVSRRADPRNGLCLNALFDRTFDRGLITIDEDHRVLVSRRLREDSTTARLPLLLHPARNTLHGHELTLPSRFHPAPQALEYHWEHVFKDGGGVAIAQRAPCAMP